MNCFRTLVPMRRYPFSITYSDEILTLGSCFAGYIGEKLSYHKIRVTNNPLGVLFHPLAIENLLKRSLLRQPFLIEDFFLHQELWNSYELHSSNGKPLVEQAVQQVNDTLEKLRRSVENASVTILTLGTAWVYETSDSKIVASCHKQPGTYFSKRILSVEELERSFLSIAGLIRRVNPQMRFLWTISPVRHIKDGFVENQRSKSHLITALHRFLEKESEFHHYFPAYELVLDELRDYRFYAEDMLHPSPQAVDYIWDKFQSCFFPESDRKFAQKIAQIQRSLQHRPFYRGGVAYRKFREDLMKEIAQIQQKYSYIRFENVND